MASPTTAGKADLQITIQTLKPQRKKTASPEDAATPSASTCPLMTPQPGADVKVVVSGGAAAAALGRRGSGLRRGGPANRGPQTVFILFATLSAVGTIVLLLFVLFRGGNGRP